MKRFAATLLICAALPLASCGQGHTTAAPGGSGAATEAAKGSDGKEDLRVLNDFSEEPAATQPPSYEVAIASAAADENQAIEACAERAVGERKACKEEARARWEKSVAEAANLRGTTQP
jgi:hypothetical protein